MTLVSLVMQAGRTAVWASNACDERTSIVQRHGRRDRLFSDLNCGLFAVRSLLPAMELR